MARRIGRYGILIPRPQLWGGRLVWLTDQERPNAVALGLTSNFTKCDRLECRYLVGDAPAAAPWLDSPERATLFRTRPGLLLMLEMDRAPRHWFVSPVSLAARRDQGY